jgi:hypothetical protein
MSQRSSVHRRVGRLGETPRLLAFLTRQIALTGAEIEPLGYPESATTGACEPKKQPSSDWKRVAE